MNISKNTLSRNPNTQQKDKLSKKINPKKDKPTDPNNTHQNHNSISNKQVTPRIPSWKSFNIIHTGQNKAYYWVRNCTKHIKNIPNIWNYQCKPQS